MSLCYIVSSFDNLPVVSCKYLCLMWSYLGGWCSFCFYLVSCSSCCSCYLYWNCHSLFVVAMVGLFCNHNYLLLTCHLVYLGGCCISLLQWVLKWWYLWRVPLVYSEVICLCDGKLDVLYPAEMMNQFALCWFDFTRWMIAGGFYV